MTGEIAEAVVGGVFVRLAQCGIVEDLLDEFVDGLAVVEDHHSNMDKLGGALADQAHAEKFSIRAREYEFEHSRGVADDVAAGVVLVVGATDAIVDVFFLAGFFRFSGGGDFWNGVNAHRKHARDALFVLEAKGVANGYASLFHGSGSQRGKTDHIACGVNIGNRGPIVVVDWNIAAVVDGETGLFQREAIDCGAAACGKKGGFSLERFAAFHRKADPGRGILYFHRALVEQKAHAERGEAIAEAVGDFRVEERQEAIASVNERDLNSESDENGCVFTADDAAADHGEAFRDAVHLKKCVRIKRVNIIEGDLGRAMRLRTGGNQNDFAVQTTHAVCTANR